MREIIINQAASCDLKELVAKFIPEMIGREIEKATSSIYPLQNVFIRKVKILKAPKFDLGKLMEVCFKHFSLSSMFYNILLQISNIVIISKHHADEQCIFCHEKHFLELKYPSYVDVLTP